MANRNLSTEQQSANQQQSVRFFELLYLRVRETGSTDYEHTFLTNAPYDVTVDTSIASMGIGLGTQTFIALGPFLQFSAIDEAADFQINQVTVSLAGLRGQDLSLFLENQYIDQPIKLFRVWFDGDGLRIGDPVMIFDGRIDKPVVSDDPDNGVVIGCSASSHWVDYERRGGRHTNHSEQQFLDRAKYGGTSPNLDTGFKFASQAIKDLKWGD
jgi:hypothetical protein